MAVQPAGKPKQYATSRVLKNQVTKDGSDPMITPGGSFKYRTKRSLKYQAGVRDT